MRLRDRTAESLRQTAARTGLSGVRVIEEMGQWVEIRKPRGKTRPDRKETTAAIMRPKAPKGWESNWLETVPDKSFFVALRMYGPLDPWINKTWRPGEVEPVE